MSFWNEGYNAVYINSYYDNPFEHSTSDIKERIDFEFLAKVTKAALATVTHLANDENLSIKQ